jgi:hypothetical protein
MTTSKLCAPITSPTILNLPIRCEDEEMSPAANRSVFEQLPRRFGSIDYFSVLTAGGPSQRSSNEGTVFHRCYKRHCKSNRPQYRVAELTEFRD